MTIYTVINHRAMWRSLCVISLLSVGACASSSPPERGIKWLAQCEGLPVAGLDSQVVSRTQCGIVTVPLDHLNPELGTLDLDITRVTAKRPEQKEGAIFTNPGGPGANGNDVFTVFLVSIWKGYGDRSEGAAYRHLIDTYDVIGITPRGQGSTPGSQLVCQSDESIVAQNDITEDRSAANLKAIRHNTAVLARGCASQRLSPYINTDQTARDMEFVRIILNEKKLNYFGNSYGTWLGAWYAGLFPAQVGRMVLDSSVDWTSTLQKASLSIAPEKERVFTRFVAQHIANNPQAYALGKDPDAIRQSFLTLLPQIRVALRSDNDFYSSPSYFLAAQVLNDWLQSSPDLQDAELQAKAQTHRFSLDTTVDQSAKDAFTTLLAAMRNPPQWNGIALGPLKLSPADSVRSNVLCNDSPSSDDAFWTRKEDIYATRYPVGGSVFHARHCAGWSGKAHSAVPLQALAQVDSLLMVQAEYDDQTPTSGAFKAFESLPNAHMTLLKGVNRHGVSFTDSSDCVNRHVGQYLAYGKKPERLSTCTAPD